MVRVESNDGMNQVFMEGNGVTVLAECLMIIPSLYQSLKEHGMGILFKAMLIRDVLTGEAFADADRRENVTGLSHKEMLDIWRDMEKDRDAIWENILKKGMVDE